MASDRGHVDQDTHSLPLMTPDLPELRSVKIAERENHPYSHIFKLLITASITCMRVFVC